MKSLVVFFIFISYSLSALGAPIKCAEDDSACLIQSLTDEVIQRQYLEKKLAASDKEKTLAEQFAQEQKQRAEKAEAQNDNRMTGSTWFLCGVLGGVIITTAVIFAKNIATSKN